MISLISTDVQVHFYSTPKKFLENKEYREMKGPRYIPGLVEPTLHSCNLSLKILKPLESVCACNEKVANLAAASYYGCPPHSNHQLLPNLERNLELVENSNKNHKNNIKQRNLAYATRTATLHPIFRPLEGISTRTTIASRPFSLIYSNHHFSF